MDIGGLGDAPYVFALGAGAPLKVVSIVHAEGRYTTAILAPRDSPLNDARDLKGKRIVTTRGSIGHFLAIKALRSVGLSTRDVQFIYLLPSESRILLDNGSADAWSTWDPYTTIATTQSQAKVLVSGDNLLSNHLYLAATRQAITDKRQQLEDFVARVDRAYRWTNAHPQEFAAAQARSPACRWPCTWRWHRPRTCSRWRSTTRSSAACKPPRTSTARKASSAGPSTSPRASTRASTPRACNSTRHPANQTTDSGASP